MGNAANTSHLRSLAVLAALSLSGCAATPAPAPQAAGVRTYDGTYQGIARLDKGPSGYICPPNLFYTLKVSNGVGSMTRAVDGRTGTVDASGRLQMFGAIGDSSGTIDGQFSAKAFTGLSTSGDPAVCTYRWVLNKV